MTFRKKIPHLSRDYKNFYSAKGLSGVKYPAQWMKENDSATLFYAGEELISVEPPMFVELEVTETDPGFKGDTVQGGTKPATLETGAVIQVPMFINIGDKLQVDTRDGRFIKRA